MKRIIGSLLVAILALPFLGAGQAWAGTVVQSQIIHITATVAPIRCIIVDNNNRIMQVTSNTPEAVTPRVFRSSVQAGNELPLTPALQQQYQAILATADTSHAGVLYDASKQPANHPSKSVMFVSLLVRPLHSLVQRPFYL